MNNYLFFGNQMVTLGGTSGPTTNTTNAWIRPSDWLPFPNTSSCTGSAGAFYGLYTVTTGSANFVALSATCATSYSVVWGDGTPTQSYLSTTQSQHQYTYDLLSGSTYSSGSGGLGYRQAMIQLIPSGSSPLTAITIQKIPVGQPLGTGIYTVNWLDIAVGGTNLTSITIGGTTVNNYTLQNCNIASMSSSLTSFLSFFSDCTNLENVILCSTTNVTNMGGMFNFCYNLRNVPLFDTSNNTNFSSMFSTCYNLQSIPAFNCISGSNFASMFFKCENLQSIPLINTSNGTSFASMFSTCNALQAIPFLSVGASTGSGNFATMFIGCSNLKVGAMSGSRSTLNYASGALDYPSILAIYNNLGITGSVACSITTSVNYGSSSLQASDIAIATNKGWTVLP